MAVIKCHIYVQKSSIDDYSTADTNVLNYMTRWIVCCNEWI